jgi:hypothetical protein
LVGEPPLQYLTRLRINAWRRHWRGVGQSIGGDAVGTPQKLKGVTGARADGHGLSAAVNRPAECL